MKLFRFLDRDVELALATKAKQAASGSVSLHQADNELIIVNMQF